MCNDPPVSSRTIPTDPEPSSACLSRTVASPIGPLTLLATRKGLARVCFAGELVGHDTGTRSGHPGQDSPGCEEQMNSEAAAILNDTECQLTENFAQHRRHFDIPLDWSTSTGATLTHPRPSQQRSGPMPSAFTRQVFQGLLQIDYGQRWSYGKLATELGHPGAARAVGSACGRNPIPIVVPCHRVVHADGSMGGYRGGGAVKRFLLRLEAASRAWTRQGDDDPQLGLPDH